MFFIYSYPETFFIVDNNKDATKCFIYNVFYNANDFVYVGF